MADIAAIFHWPPETFDRMPLEDLMSWREMAIERAELFGLIERKR